MSEPSAEQKTVDAVLKRIDVIEQAPDRFVSETSRMGGPRLFGGLVAGQAVVAATRTVPGLTPHSLHAYFLQPGDPTLPVEYAVDRIKEGKNFHARMVTGRQEGRVIFSMQMSFLRPEQGFAHQDPMPDAPAPESLDAQSMGFWGMSSPLRMRECAPAADPPASPMRRVWIKPAATLPEDPVLHLGMIVFASDMSLVATGLLPHPELRRKFRGGASLDHAMWFHRPTGFDDWMLYTMQTPAAHGSRALIQGAMYRRDGTRVISVAQEGLLRSRDGMPVGDRSDRGERGDRGQAPDS